MDDLSLLASILSPGAVTTDPAELMLRAHDSWALTLLRRARGERPPLPSAVLLPTSTEEVAAILAWAARTRTVVVPRGGGSGVCGGVQAAPGWVVLDISRMDQLLELDHESQVVGVQAGMPGDRLEAALQERGLTLGHYPQSIQISTVGGW